MSVNHSSQSNHDVDRLLEEYFRSETPHPWPGLPPLPQNSLLPGSRTSFFKRFGRLALAACLALFVLGYWTLAGFFPRENSSSRLDVNGHLNIAKQLNHKPGSTPLPQIAPKSVNPQKKS